MLLGLALLPIYFSGRTDAGIVEWVKPNKPLDVTQHSRHSVDGIDEFV